jgi:hypothetical protein
MGRVVACQTLRPQWDTLKLDGPRLDHIMSCAQPFCPYILHLKRPLFSGGFLMCVILDFCTVVAARLDFLKRADFFLNGLSGKYQRRLHISNLVFCLG